MTPVRRPFLSLWLLCLSLGCLTRAQTAELPAEVANLPAFARLFGYLRYFHPSDEGQMVDWDRLAAYGAVRVLDTGSRDELGDTLQDLFGPVAPTLELYSGDTPKPPGIQPQAAAGAVVAWQHRGVGLGSSTGTYASIRTGRRNLRPGPGASFGTVTQTLDAEPYRGEEIRLRFDARTAAAESGGRGQGWLRVDRPSGRVGFFDNMQDRPVVSSDWQSYEILGRVDGDAERIAFGFFLSGSGRAWVDDLGLEVRETGGSWRPIEIANPGFEEGNGKPNGWFAGSHGYDYVFDDDAREGDRSLRVERRRVEVGNLFEPTPKLGEAIDIELVAGLRARVPLALPVESRAVTPPAPLEALIDRLADVELVDPADPAVRLAGVIVAWNVFQHFYPYFDVVATDWDAVLSESLASALAGSGREDYYRTMAGLVAALEDGHGRVLDPVREPTRAGLPLAFEWIEERVVVTAVEGTGEVLPGDLLRSIDGVEVDELLTAIEALVSGSPQWKRVRALREELGRGPLDTPASLVLERRGERRTVTLARRAGLPPQEAKRPAIDDLGDRLLYVDLDRATMRDLGPRMDELTAARGLIFDLRGYPRGNHAILQHLTDEPLASAIWQVPQRIYPDRERLVGYDTSGRWNLPAAIPRIRGRAVFLTDARAISYAESVLGIVEHYRLGEIVGQPTAGANGNVNPFEVPGGLRLTWTGMRVLKHDRSQHHLIGIQPTVPATRTIEGVRQGRDEVLERAIELFDQG